MHRFGGCTFGVIALSAVAGCLHARFALAEDYMPEDVFMYEFLEGADISSETLRTTFARSSWTAEPRGRGTFSILQSCILTLIACIYTALHLNVPEDTVWWKLTLLKLRWILLTLFVPEFVVDEAFRQFCVAKKLRDELRCILKELPGEPKTIGLRYAYFIIMGGLRIRVSALGNAETLERVRMSKDWEEYFEDLGLGTSSGYTPGNASLQLTPFGVKELARDHWSDLYVSDEMIKDKSKVNTLQKCLVLLQICWMFIVCVARLTYGLPLTLLEIHTMVHVGCAVVLFVLWLKKPLDILDPIVKEDKDCQPWASHMEELTSSWLRSDFDDTEQAFGITTNLGSELHEIDGSAATTIFQPIFVYLLRSGTGRFQDPGGLLLKTLNAVYGGLHLLAWSFSFPTSMEAMYWKVACFFIIFKSPVSVIFLWPFLASDEMEGCVSTTLTALMLIFLGVIAGVVFLCRLFIVIESFANLRKVPVGVFYVPSWLQTIPHV